MKDTRAFIAGLPKAELHIHLEGSLEPEMMFALAARNNVAIPFKSVEDVRAAYRFFSLQDFLDIYYKGADVLRTEEDFYDLTMAYLKRAHADGVVHAEMFFDPQTHTARGVALGDVIGGISHARDIAHAEFGMSSKLILCFLRHLSEDYAFETWRYAHEFFGKYIDGVGLDSSELGHPPAKFAKLFAAVAASEPGYSRVAHAGEEGPPEYVWEALDLLKVDRLDHGNRSLEDPALVKRLVAEQMTLTVCPLSNQKLGAVPDIAAHPLKQMLDLGLRATVNSDDPAYFGGYLNDNFNAVAPALTRAEIVTLAKNSFLGSFLGDADKAEHIAAIDAYDAAFVE